MKQTNIISVGSRTRARSPENKARRRDAILIASEHHLRLTGVEGFALGPIANELDIAKGTIYLYFETRETLLLALIERKIQRWFEALMARIPEIGSDSDWAAAVYETAHVDPDLLQLLLRQDLIIEHNISLTRCVEYKRLWRAWLESLAEAVETPLDFTPVQALEAVKVTGPVLFAFCHAEQGPDLSDPDTPRDIREFFSPLSAKAGFIKNLERILRLIRTDKPQTSG